jgi:hypothetical protein
MLVANIELNFKKKIATTHNNQLPVQYILDEVYIIQIVGNSIWPF